MLYIANHKSCVRLCDRLEYEVLHPVNVLILVYVYLQIFFGVLSGGICRLSVFIYKKAHCVISYVSEGENIFLLLFIVKSALEFANKLIQRVDYLGALIKHGTYVFGADTKRALFYISNILFKFVSYALKFLGVVNSKL